MARNELEGENVKTFQENIQSAWKQLQYQNKFCDVTLVCGDKQIEAHKIVISCNSPLFKSILKQNKQQHPIIYLKDVNCKDLENLLLFMYQGELNIYAEDVSRFFQVGEDLKIRGLYQECGKSSNIELSPILLNENMLLTDLDITNETISEEIEGRQNRSQEHDEFSIVINENISGKIIKDNIISTDLDISNSISPNETKCDKIVEEKSEKKRLKHGILLIARNKKDAKEQKDLSFHVHKRTVFQCDKCSYTASKSCNLKTHIESIHEGILYPCNQCTHKATKKYNLKIHIETVHDGIQRQIPARGIVLCDQCSYRTTRKSHLKNHIESVHKGVRYPCDHCNYKATDKDYLKKHIKSIHGGIFFACNECNYKATRKLYLRTHTEKRHSKQLTK